MSDEPKTKSGEGCEDPDQLGAEVKALEDREAQRAMMPGLPVVARLDGRAFHSFCRSLRKPYDERMVDSMIETTRALVEEWHAALGYTQSDEITLIWRAPEQFVQQFVQQVMQRWPGEGRERMNPCFDCRVWQVPTLEDALKVLYWREADAVKNSTSSAAQALYSPRELHGKGRQQQMDMLMAKGVNWNDYPPSFKRGSYLKRVVVERVLTEEERSRIPEKHRPTPEQTFKRGRIDVLDLPPLRRVVGAVELLLARPSDGGES